MPFLRISLISLSSQVISKTFDLDIQMSLKDFTIFHEQFITKDNQHLCLLSAQHQQTQNIDYINSDKFFYIHILHTSLNNPLFSTPKYEGVENKIQINLNKLIITMQLEALLSIMKFQNKITQNLSKQVDSEDQNKRKQLSERESEEIRTTLNINKATKKKGK